MIKIAIPGVNGRMGSLIAQQILQTEDLCLVAATVRAGNTLLATKVANSDVTVTQDFDEDFDVLIDFTLPAAVFDHIAYCVANEKAMVIGATGFSSEQLAAVQAAARKIPIVQGYNMSIGVNACYKLIADTAQMLDDDWSVKIFDLHHQHKKDAPSGTAKEMANIITENSDCTRRIEFNSERRGEVVGEHVVTFANKFEQIVISHVSHDRAIYAQGALQAARWVCGRVPGLYGMQDVLCG